MEGFYGRAIESEIEIGWCEIVEGQRVRSIEEK